MRFILDMETDTFIDFVGEAMQKDIEDKLWEKWLHDGINEMSFDQYKLKHFEQKNKKSDEEILQDAENILKSMSRQ